MPYNLSNYGNDLCIELDDAASGSHSGSCDNDIAELRRVPYIAKQLDELDPDQLRRELKEYGAWEDDELDDHDTNLSRWLWISCGDIVENEANDE